MSSSPPLVVADRYRLVAPLGQGGMGRVWRATDVVLHRDVAIKELVPPPGLTPGERQEMRERSLREARAIARLNNVNVVRVFDVLRTDADPWIVMEYVASRSLHDTLAADGPFNPVRAAEIGLGVLNALRAAHRAGVVHRDVKPGNVLIGADGRVVLTDFGLATVPGDPNVTRTGLVLGSPAYIAPERARDGTAGPAADLWSLGATLYAAVEGASPFARPSAIATLAALATENPPQSRNAGPLKPVLNGLLRKDPTHRINAEEAERLLLRATGRRSKLSFPMSPTMRRPGLGRALPPTGAMPVVPGPRPPVAPSRPSNPPGQAPASGARAAAGDGRPPVFVPGKASVGRPPDKPTRVDPPKVDASRLDPTRVDGPPVRDGQPPFGTRQAPPPPATPPSRPARSRAGEVDPSLARTVRGGPGGFTAADVAAARRKKAAPEHEKSLADAAAAMGQPVDATTVVPPSGKTRPGRKPAAAEQPALADATTVVPPPADRHRLDATTVVPPTADGPRPASADGPRPASADATTVVPAPARPGRKPAVTAPSGDATTVVPSAGRPAPVDMTTVVSPAVGPATTAPPADPTTVVRHPAEPTTVVKHPIDVPSADATTVVPPPSRTGGKPKATVEAPTEPEKALSSEAGADKPEAAKTGDARGDKVVETAGSTTSRTAAGATASSVSGNAATTASRDAASSASGNAASSASKNAGESASAAIARSAEEVAGTTSEEVAATGAERGAGSSAAGLAASSATESTAADAARAGVGGTAEVEAEKAIEESEAKSTKGNRLGSAKSKTPPAVEAAEPLLALEAAPADAEAVPADAAPADAVAAPADAEAAPIDAAESALPGASALITEEDGAPSSEAVTPEAQPESAELEPAAKAESGGAAGKETRLTAANAKAGAANAEAGAANAEAGAANAEAGAANAEAGAPNAKAGAANAKAGAANAKAGAANATAGSEDLADPIEDIDDEPAESAVQVALPLARKRRPARTDGGLVGGDPADGMPSDMAPFSPAARPAWKPMQVSPTFRPSAGITIFGTRLTYRQAGIGAAALLVILVLLIVLAVKAFGGGDGKPSAGPTAAKTAATGGPVRNGAGPAPTTGATTAPSSRSSVAPSSEAPARGAAMKLPAGWKWYNRSTQGDWPGFAIPIPQNAAIEPEGSQIYIRWNNRLLIVDRTNAPRPDPVQDWKDQEGNRSYRNYQKIKIVAVNYGGFKASADWEFTYTTDNGNAQHADKRNILVSGSAAYSLNWYTTPADWAASQSDLQAIYQGFQPKP